MDTSTDFHFILLEGSKGIQWSAILMMAPIAFVTMTEHMGHITVLNRLTKRDFFQNHRFTSHATW